MPRMAFSQAYKILWYTGIVFVILPHFNLGLLSDYKICGDTECESLMSRVQATRDHRGKDCRFLNFKRGDTVFVYHKLTGKRDDLWAGTIGRQFGYFPKDAVQEEQVYASTEKVVETQKSDFICMDEFGYPIDSSHLDSDDDSDDDQQIQNQDSESLKLTVDTSTESPSAGSADPSTQPLVSAQQPDSTSAGEDENKSVGDDAARIHKEAHETPAAMSKQGGSPSSSWLGSSVKGWLGLGKEGQPGNLAEGEKNDENRETQAEASLSSSVTGWLGFGGEGKPEYAVNNQEEEEKTAASLMSTMTGWLGLVGDTKTDFTKKEQDEEREMDDESEPKETFRSRRMSLDLEGSQLHEEEKKEMGTLDWLGNGLSSTLGFGGSNQEPETIEEENENPNSWLDMGVGDILGFRKHKNENDESTGSGFEESDKDKTLEQATALGNVDISQSPPAETEQEKTEPGLQTLEEKIGTEAIPDVGDNSISSSSNKDTYQSNVEKHDRFPQSETESATLPTEKFFNNNNIDALDGSKDSVLPVGAAARVDQKEVSPQTILERSSLTVAVLSSRTDEERSAETVSEEQQIAVNKGEDNDRESGEEQIKTASNNDRDFLTHSNSDLESNLYSTYSNSMGQSVANNVKVSKDQLQSKATESLEQAVAKIISQANNPEDFTIVSFEIGASNDGHENERSNTETDVHLMEISTTQTDASAEQSQISGNAEESSGKSQSSLSSDIAQEENEPSHSEEDGATEADILDTVAMNDDNNTDAETHQGELVQIAEVHQLESSSQELESSPSSNRSTQNLYKNVPEEEILSQDTMVDNTDHNSASLETETEEVEESKEEIQKVEEIKEGERQQKTEERKKEVDEIKEDEENEDKDKLKKNENMEVKHEQVDILKGDERQEEVYEMEKQEEVKEGERQVGVDKVKTEEKKEEVEEIKEEEKHDDVERLSDVEDVNEENKQMTKELEQEKQLEVEEKQEEEVKLKEEEKQNELKDIEMLKERVKEEGEEKQIQSPHLEVQNKNTHDVGKPRSESNDKDTHSENPKTEWAEEEKREEEMTKLEKVEEVKEEKKEVEEMQHVEGEREKQENVQKCSNQLCLKTTEDESVRDRNENISEGGSSSADEATVQRGRQNDQMLADMAGESAEKDRLREEEKEKTPNDATADQVEKNNSASNTTGTEDIHSNNPNSVSEDSALEAEQIGATKYSENELEPPGDKYIDKILSEHKIESLSLTSDSEKETHPHVFQNPTGSSLPPGEHNRGSGEKESTGAFGLFQNAFSYLSETAVTESKNATEFAPSLDTNTGEMSQPQASLTLKQEPDSTTDSSHVSVRDLNKNSPIAIPTQQPEQLPPPSSEIHSQFYTPSPHAGTPLQTKTLSKHYKSLLSHVSVDEVTILMELFGRHKMQFLDYILGSLETVTNDSDNDESILSDIERLLDYHRETLVAPSMRLADAAQEDKEKTRTLIALQKLEILLGRLRDEFSTGKSDVNKANPQAEASCAGATCWTYSKDKEESRKTQDSSISHDIKRDKWVAVEKDSGYLGGVIGKGRKTEDERRVKTGTEEENDSHRHFEPGSPQPLEGAMKPILDFVRQIAEQSCANAHTVRELIWITVQVVSSLPDDIRPGPDLYGVPWEPVIISSLVGLVTVLLFTCRCFSSVKSRMYQRKERWMAEQVAQLLDEKCKVLETLSNCQQEYDDLKDSMRDSGVLAQSQKTEQLEIKARQLEQAKRELESDLRQLNDQLEQQREHRIEQERRIAMLEESMKTLEEETKDLQSQEEQAQTTLKVYSMNSDRLQKNLETAGEENTLLQESNAQLRQQVEGWAERVSELEAEMRRCEVAYSGMQQDVANKDARIMSLTDCLLRMRAWESDLEEEEGDKGGKEETSNGTAGKGDIMDTQGHLQKVQKLIYAAKLNADLKSLDEDKDRVFAKLNDEVKAKEDLQGSIKELENEKLTLQSDAVNYLDQVQRLQQKLQIMTEMYQENELKLHRLLTVEERERLQKEEKLNKADKNIVLAMEEVNNYRQRAEEMEDELEKTKQSYQTQISAHEKKAHNNWLAARAAERELADIRRENALLRQKLTDTQFKLDAIDKDPYALNSLARPLPFRAEGSPYGLSPLGRPASETRAFLSPPTLMDGPATRLSPRVSRGPMEPPGGQGELERSGGPHSDSGSISPTWEKDRRGPPLVPPPGPLGPPGPVGRPGYMFPEPGGPMYRRPLPPPGAMGVLPPPGSLPPGPPLPHTRGFPSAAPPGPPHPTDMADGAYRENSLGPSEQESKESGPGDRRTPSEADPRMGGPSMGPTGGPMDGPFPRRPLYGPPPPDFYPPRVPGGPPMMWARPPSAMMFPARFPPGGPSLPPAPHPQFAPPMRPSAPDRFPPPSMASPSSQQSVPSLQHSQSQEQHTPSPEDAI